jgi:hypothetical protein
MFAFAFGESLVASSPGNRSPRINATKREVMLIDRQSRLAAQVKQLAQQKLFAH